MGVVAKREKFLSLVGVVFVATKTNNTPAVGGVCSAVYMRMYVSVYS